MESSLLAKWKEKHALSSYTPQDGGVNRLHSTSKCQVYALKKPVYVDWPHCIRTYIHTILSHVEVAAFFHIFTTATDAQNF